MIPESTIARLRAHLHRIYPDRLADEYLPRLVERLNAFRRAHPEAGSGRLFDQTDVVLITYGDQVRESGTPTLETLRKFLGAHLAGVITGVHLLPHHPFSSDDGFAVTDYTTVNPVLGDWTQVDALAREYRLMLDAVVNHTSASHPWFLRSVSGDPQYADFYHYPDPALDLSAVVRPRTTPLLSRTWSPDPARQWVWTTFSADQVDLNYANPEVLLAVTDVLLNYLAHGAGMLRLDAIGFLWKEPGTSCLHLPQTHEIVRLWRTVVDAVAPGTLLVTETNVPHAENISYFGDGTNEAHLVYQFPLPPLTLLAFHTGDATGLAEWAAQLTTPGPAATFLNFLGSHDGIGVRPLEGLVPPVQVTMLCEQVWQQGGQVSYRTLPDGTTSPYELNISYFDALQPPQTPEPRVRQVDRFLAAHSILLALAGVPAIYFHALFGSRSWPEGAEHTGQPRTINRQKFARATVEAELADPGSLRYQILRRLRERIAVRAGQPAFHPAAEQRVSTGTGGRFVLQRTPAAGGGSVLCVHDVSGRDGRFRGQAPDRLPAGARLVDLCDGSEFRTEADGTVEVPLPAYGVRWLQVS